jgi:hypothetical protein
LRSLIIYGTRMGFSGLKHIISLGIAHLQTLTIGQTGMTHHFGSHLGTILSSFSTSTVHTLTSLPLCSGSQLIQSTDSTSSVQVPQTILRTNPSCAMMTMCLHKVKGALLLFVAPLTHSSDLYRTGATVW